MQIRVLVRPVPEVGYRASCGAPFELSADGTTAGRAIDRLKDRVRELMDAGAWVVTVDVPVVERAEGDDPTSNLGGSDEDGVPEREPAA
jgi:hypothetical protein